MTKITNMEQVVADNPLLGLLLADEDSIVAQEHQGQRQAVASAVLPTKDLDQYEPGGAYGALGFQILDLVDGDPMFTNVVLPEGWRVAATDHSLHNDILDAKGQRRASYFYKAAFYDRDAFMYPAASRYTTQPGCDPERTQATYLVIDRVKAKWSSDGSVCAEAIIHVAVVDVLDPEHGYWKAKEVAEVQARQWIADTYPNNRDVTAYWE